MLTQFKILMWNLLKYNKSKNIFYTYIERPIIPNHHEINKMKYWSGININYTYFDFSTNLFYGVAKAKAMSQWLRYLYLLLAWFLNNLALELKKKMCKFPEAYKNTGKLRDLNHVNHNETLKGYFMLIYCITRCTRKWTLLYKTINVQECEWHMYYSLIIIFTFSSKAQIHF